MFKVLVERLKPTLSAHWYWHKSLQNATENVGTKSETRTLSTGPVSLSTPTWPIETITFLSPSNAIPCGQGQSLSACSQSRPKLFFVHGLDGHCRNFKNIADNLPTVDCYGLQFSQEVPETSIRDIAARYIHEMKSVEPKGPYNICGYSTGGATAFEMASQLEAERKDNVSNFLVLDGQIHWDPQRLDLPKSLTHLLSKFVNDLEKLQVLQNELHLIRQKHFEELLRHCVVFVERELVHPERTEVIKYVGRLLRLLKLIFDHETPNLIFTGPTTIVRAKERVVYFDLLQDQHTYNVKQKCQGPLSVHVVEGDHNSFLRPPYAAEMAAILSKINFSQ